MKRVLSLILAIIMCVSVGPMAVATGHDESTYTLPQELLDSISERKATLPNMTAVYEDDVNMDDLYDQLSARYLELELARENNAKLSEITLIQGEIDNIHRQLEQCGSIALTSDEVTMLASNTVSTPPDTNNVEFQAHGPVNYVYDGESYQYYRFTAIPKTQYCVLSDNESIDMQMQVKLKDYLEIPFYIYVQKIAGLVKYLQWTPYELLFSDYPSAFTELTSDYTVLTYARTTAQYYFVADENGVFTQGFRFDNCRLTEAHNIYYEEISEVTQFSVDRRYLGEMPDSSLNQIETAIENVYATRVDNSLAASVDMIKFARKRDLSSTAEVHISYLYLPQGPNSMYVID